MKILEILTWGRSKQGSKDLQPLSVKFSTLKPNMIVGAEGSGKTSLFYIIDFCLGANKCRIPNQNFLEKIQWYGIVIETYRGIYRVVRGGPNSKFKNKIEIIPRADLVGLPLPTLDNNKCLNVFQARDALTDLFHPEIKSICGMSYGDFGKVTFRDLLLFSFLPTSVQTDPNRFFEDYGHHARIEKNKKVMPYLSHEIDIEELKTRFQRFNDRDSKYYPSLNKIFDDVHLKSRMRKYLDLSLSYGLIEKFETQCDRSPQSAFLKSVLWRVVLLASDISLLLKKRVGGIMDLDLLQQIRSRCGITCRSVEQAYEIVLLGKEIYGFYKCLDVFSPYLSENEFSAFERKFSTPMSPMVPNFQVGKRLQEIYEQLTQTVCSDLSFSAASMQIRRGAQELHDDKFGSLFSVFSANLALFIALHISGDCQLNNRLFPFIFLERPNVNWRGSAISKDSFRAYESRFDGLLADLFHSERSSLQFFYTVRSKYPNSDAFSPRGSKHVVDLKDGSALVCASWGSY